jgi:hypothetical protein
MFPNNYPHFMLLNINLRIYAAAFKWQQYIENKKNVFKYKGKVPLGNGELLRNHFQIVGIQASIVGVSIYTIRLRSSLMLLYVMSNNIRLSI